VLCFCRNFLVFSAAERPFVISFLRRTTLYRELFLFFVRYHRLDFIFGFQSCRITLYVVLILWVPDWIRSMLTSGTNRRERKSRRQTPGDSLFLLSSNPSNIFLIYTRKSFLYQPIMIIQKDRAVGFPWRISS
jgi:hypothetical protein